MLLNYDAWNRLDLSQMRKNDILTTFRSLQRAHNTKSPHGLCNGFTSGWVFFALFWCVVDSFLCFLVSCYDLISNLKPLQHTECQYMQTYLNISSICNQLIYSLYIKYCRFTFKSSFKNTYFCIETYGSAN